MTDDAKPLIGKLPPCGVLRQMHADRQVVLPSGETKRTTSGISVESSWALYGLVLKEAPKVVVEIGMAQGFSTLSILCALAQTGGRLISIDPYVNWKSGRDAALHNIQRAGYAQRHSLMEEESCRALPKLLEEDLEVNLGYIDGKHAFEHALIDFFYLDRMLAVGGVIGFNNAGWPSVHRVIRFLKKQRRYVEVDVGLRPDYRARNVVLSFARRVLRMPRQDRYFRKTADAED